MIDSTTSEINFSLKVRVVPRASRSEVVGDYDGGIKVRLAAPPVGGKANEELIRLLSKVFSVSRSNIAIVSGRSSKIKFVRIAGLSQSIGERLLKQN